MKYILHEIQNHAAVDWLQVIFDGIADNVVEKIVPPGGAERPGP